MSVPALLLFISLSCLPYPSSRTRFESGPLISRFTVAILIPHMYLQTNAKLSELTGLLHNTVRFLFTNTPAGKGATVLCFEKNSPTFHCCSIVNCGRRLARMASQTVWFRKGLETAGNINTLNFRLSFCSTHGKGRVFSVA